MTGSLVPLTHASHLPGSAGLSINCGVKHNSGLLFLRFNEGSSPGLAQARIFRLAQGSPYPRKKKGLRCQQGPGGLGKLHPAQQGDTQEQRGEWWLWGAGRSCWPMGLEPQLVNMISRDLLRNTVPSATSAVLWKRVDLTLCSYNNNNNKTAHLPLLLGPSAFLTADQTLDSL